MTAMERNEVGDRQLDALLERLDRLCDEMHSLNRRLDRAITCYGSLASWRC